MELNLIRYFTKQSSKQKCNIKKNAKLKNDLLTVDSAIQLYKMEKGKCPEKLEDLVSEYIARNKGFQDATNTVFSYAIADNGLNYILKGNDAEGKEVVSDGSKQS